MNTNDKIKLLNLYAQTLRDSVKEIGLLFPDSKEIPNLVWKINKQISLLHQEVCKTLEKEITNEDFQDIIKNLENNCE